MLATFRILRVALLILLVAIFCGVYLFATRRAVVSRAQDLAPTMPAMNPGDLDTTFDTDGRVTTDFAFASDQAYTLAQQPDGKLLAAGYTTRASSFRAFALARYNADGTLDISFGTGGKVVTNFDAATSFNAEAQDLVIQPDGKILVVGFSSSGSGNGSVALARYLADGSSDASFGTGGKVTTRFDNFNCLGYALALLPNGSFFVAGTVQTGGANEDFLLARYLPDGSLDAGFGNGGRVATDFMDNDRALDMVLQTDGKVILGGYRNGNLLSLARYNPDGTLDATFGTQGRINENFTPVRALALQADGKLLAITSTGLTRYQTNGTLDSSLGVNGRLAVGNATSVAVQSNGKIVVGSISFNSFTVDVFLPNGARDIGFGSGGRVVTAIGNQPVLNDLLLQSDNKIVAAGTTTPTGGGDFALVRYFGADDGAGGCSYAISLDRQVILASGGAGATVNVTAPTGCAWTAASNSSFVTLTSGTNGTGNGTVTFTVAANSSTTARNGTLTIAGRTFTVAQLGLNAVINDPGSLDFSFDYDGFVVTDVNNTNDEANGLLLQPDGKMLVVGTVSSGGISAPVVLRYLADGTLDNSFGTGGKVVLDFGGVTDTGLAGGLQPDGKIIVAGSRSHPSFGSDFALARLLPNGALDTGFGTGGKVTTDFNLSLDSANALVLQSDGKIVAVGVAGSSAGNDFGLARYETNGNLDATFGAGGKVTVDLGATNDEARAVALQSDGGLIITGRTFNSTLGTNITGLARILPNGTLDANFGIAGKVTTTGGEARDLVLQPDGKILVAAEQFMLFRYQPDGTPDVGFGVSGKVLVRPLSGTSFTQISAFGVALQPDQKILLGGFCFLNSTNFCAARVLPDGAVDAGFGVDGFVNADAGGTESGKDIALLPDGKIILAGARSDSTNQTPDIALARLNNGANCTYSVAPMSHAVASTGGSRTVNVTTQAGCAWAANVGTATFASITSGANGTGNGTVTFNVGAYTGTDARRGLLNIAGLSVSVAQLSPSALTSGTGSNDLSFDFDGVVTTNFNYRSNDTAYAMTQQPDGKLLLAGSVGGATFNGSPVGFAPDFGVARYNPDGSLDNSFGVGGKVTTEITSRTDEVLALAVQPDGKIIVAGRAPADFNVRNDIALVRYLSNGALDRSFGSNGIVISNINNRSSRAQAVAVQPDGKIVVGGAVNIATDNDDFVVLRYHADGTPDTSFSGGRVLTDFEGRNDQVNDLAILPDGRIVAAGYETITGQVTRSFGLVRYNANGILDSTFGTGGKVITPGGFATDLTLQPDGRLLAVGGSSGGTYSLLRYLPNGGLDGSFGVNGRVGINDIGATVLKLQDNGSILLASGSQVQRRQTNGALDLSFGVNGTTQVMNGNSSNDVRGLAVQPGYIILGGSAFNQATSNFDFMLARLNDGPSCTYSISSNGQTFPANGGTASVTVSTQNGCAWRASLTDANFVTLNAGSTGNGSGIVTFTVNSNSTAAPRTGLLTIAGQSFLVEQRGLNMPASAPGTLDAGFDGDGRSIINYVGDSNETITDVATQTDGRIVATGATSQGNGSIALLRFNPDGTLDETFGFGGRVASNVVSIFGSNDAGRSVALQADGKIVVGATSGFAIFRYQSDGSLDATFGNGGYVQPRLGDSNGNEFLTDIKLLSSGKILAVGGTQVNNISFAALTRLNADGSVDTTFGTQGKTLLNFNFGGTSGQTALVLGDDKIMLVARGFNSVGSTGFDFILARLTAQGALDQSFGNGGFVTTDFRTNGSDEPSAIALQEDGKFIVSGSSSVAGEGRIVAARYNADGTLDTSFATSGRLVVTDFAAGFINPSALLVQPDGRIVLGTTISGSRFALLRYNPNGTRDATFGTNGVVTPFPSTVSSSCNALGWQDGGKLIAAGSAIVNSANGSDFALVRVTTGAGDGPTLAGQLKDSNNRPLRGVPVTLSGAISRVITTDATGNYSFTDLKTGGDYTLKVNSPAYLTTPQRRDLVSVTASQTGLNFAADAALFPPLSVPLTDDFNGARDNNKWSLGTLTRGVTSFDTAVAVMQANGQLAITPRANVPDAHFNGYVALNNFDFTNGAARVELVQAANGGGETAFALGAGPEFYARFAVLPVNANASQPDGSPNAPAAESPLLALQVRLGGQFRLLTLPYNPTAHRFLRLRHVPETIPAPSANASPGGYFVFETSPANPINYTELFRVAVGPRSVAQMSVELSAGTSNPLNAPGTALFDNFAASSNSSAQFAAASYSVNENAGQVTVTVTRTGDTTAGASVEYATAGGTAQAGARYLYTSGTLTFAANETSKTFTVPVLDNVLVDGTQTIEVVLSQGRGVALNSPARTIITLLDNDTPGATNAIEDAQFFVTQQYYDFLNRAPDADGLAYWTGQITVCGTDAACVRGRRIGVSAAFFVELEFQATGSVVYRLYRAAFGVQAAPNQTRAAIVYDEFSRDRAQLIGGPGLEASTRELAERFVQREAFTAQYPVTQTNAQFVNKLFDTANLTPFTGERQAEIEAMNTQGRTRAQVLLNVINLAAFREREYNPSFVLMQYFGYLRRDPDQGGYDFWLNILNQQPANARGMVCAFLTSAEYQLRFGTQTPRSNAECGPGV